MKAKCSEGDRGHVGIQYGKDGSDAAVKERALLVHNVLLAACINPRSQARGARFVKSC